jgi:hypothetical protein
MSAGWSCYCWLLGNRPDGEFSESKLAHMLEIVEKTIHDSPERTKYAMNHFIYTVGVSYLPLHDKAVETAKAVGPVEIKRDKTNSKQSGHEQTQRSVDMQNRGIQLNMTKNSLNECKNVV